MSVTDLKKAAAAVRAYWRNSPKDRLVKSGLSDEGKGLLEKVEALPDGAVVVDRAQLVALVEDLAGQQALADDSWRERLAQLLKAAP